MNNLAITYFNINRKEDALPYVRKCLEWQKRVKGKSHPETLLGMNILAIVLLQMGQVDEALSINEEKLELCLDS